MLFILKVSTCRNKSMIYKILYSFKIHNALHSWWIHSHRCHHTLWWLKIWWIQFECFWLCESLNTINRLTEGSRFVLIATNAIFMKWKLIIVHILVPLVKTMYYYLNLQLLWGLCSNQVTAGILLLAVPHGVPLRDENPYVDILLI